MNLEVLFHSAELTNNDTLRTIGKKHADTTMINHIRQDGGTWHVLHYNTFTGAVTAKRTAQGFADSRCTSRDTFPLKAFHLFGLLARGRVVRLGVFMVTPLVSLLYTFQIFSSFLERFDSV